MRDKIIDALPKKKCLKILPFFLSSFIDESGEYKNIKFLLVTHNPPETHIIISLQSTQAKYKDKISLYT